MVVVGRKEREGDGIFRERGWACSHFIRLNSRFGRFTCDSTCGLDNQDRARDQGKNKFGVRPPPPVDIAHA